MLTRLFVNIIYIFHANVIQPCHIYYSYKVIVVVKDNSAKTTFTLFNKEVERLIGVPVQSLVNKIGQVKISLTTWFFFDIQFFTVLSFNSKRKKEKLDITTHTQDKLTMTVPPTVRNVIGKKCAFEVKLTSFNQEGPWRL